MKRDLLRIVELALVAYGKDADLILRRQETVERDVFGGTAVAVAEELAEGVRFELTRALRPCRFSRPVHSTTLPTFRSRAEPGGNE